MKKEEFLAEISNPICKMGERFIRRYCGGIISSYEMDGIIGEYNTSLEVLTCLEEGFRRRGEYHNDYSNADEVKALIEYFNDHQAK